MQERKISVIVFVTSSFKIAVNCRLQFEAQSCVHSNAGAGSASGARCL